jgi:hypothetical protein
MADPARPSHPTRRSAAVALVVTIVAVTGGVVVLTAGDERDDPTAVFATAHGTRPVPLDRVAVTRIARAFGIDAEPERIVGGWEAEDDVRTLYLTRTPSAWYGTYTDSSMLLSPLGDRALICSSVAPPPGCRLPDVEFVTDVAATPPTATEARTAARRVLDEAGVSDERWRAVVLDPTDDVVPCRDDLPSRIDCTQQYVPTRPVMLSLALGGGTTDVRWGLVIGPSGDVLTATGRIAERR